MLENFLQLTELWGSPGLGMLLIKPWGWRGKKVTQIPTDVFYSNGSHSRFSLLSMVLKVKQWD